MHNRIDVKSLVFCFYNPLTLAQCEFVGRYYVGGVSELTPNEFRSIPYREISACDIDAVKQMFSDNEELDNIIAFVNSKTLDLDLDATVIKQLNSSRARLIKKIGSAPPDEPMMRSRFAML